MGLLEFRPWLIRGNASEVMTVAGAAGAGGRGVDSTVASEAALAAGMQLARQQRCLVAITGAADLVRHSAACACVSVFQHETFRCAGVCGSAAPNTMFAALLAMRWVHASGCS